MTDKIRCGVCLIVYDVTHSECPNCSRTFELTSPEPKEPKRTAEEAMAEIWAILGPKCEADDYDGIVNYITARQI